MSIEHRDINYGRKTLSLDVNDDDGSASVRFGTRSPRWFHRRIEGETTVLFQKADEILREMVKKRGAPIILRFDTANTKMKLWAESKRGLLGFDSVETNGPAGYRITVIKKY